MTIYYIDPAAGSDSNTGLSWAQAWKTLRGLRVASVVPGAGDEIRFAKSPTYTPVMGEYVRQTGDYIEWYLRGESVMSSYESGSFGINEFQGWAPPETDNATVKCYVGTFVNGAMTVDVPAWAGNMYSYYDSIHAVSNGGEYLAENQLLFGGGIGFLSSSATGGMGKFQGAVRCSVPYTGTGDVDIPAGAITVDVYNNTVLLFSVPLPAIRNSFDEWTPFEIDFTPWGASSLANVLVRFNRTSVPIARDSSPFGLEFSEFGLSKPDGIQLTETILSVARNSFSGAASPEIAGTNDMSVLLERLSAIGMSTSLDTYSADEYYNNRVASSVSAYLRCFKVPDISMTGRLPMSPTGSLGVYDLNGSSGGTQVSPLKITGGWNTSSDTVDGVTAFSAGLPHKFCSSFAWIDLHGASHVQFENLAPAYGFGSFLSRPGTVSLKKCMLPWSIKPAFGVVDVNSNIMLEDMYVAPMVLEGFGTIGDLSLKNVYYVGQQNSKATRRNEVDNLSMYDSHYGVGDTFYGPVRPLYVRGEAVLEQCSLFCPPQLVSIKFGHSLVFKNHKPFPSTGAANPIPTAPESRWDVIDYQDVSMPTYSFATPPSTGATCDAKVLIASSMFITPNHYPTGLRGHKVLNIYTDGMNDFLSTAGLASSENSERGYMYSHFMGQRPANTIFETPSTSAQYGDLAIPSWSKEYNTVTAETSIVQSPTVTASSRVLLAKKIVNVIYRSDAELYVISGRAPLYTGGFQWTALKSLYMPKAGMYRAHFGCMKENLFLTPFGGPGSDAVNVPLTAYQPAGPITSGVLLGRFGVFSNYLVGLPKIVDYYATTPEEAQAGGGNTDLDQWRDYYIDFELSAAGLVELRHGSDDSGVTATAIFDILDIYERT